MARPGGIPGRAPTPTARPPQLSPNQDVAAALASVTHADCRRLAELALAAESADGTRAVVRGQLPVLDDLGL